MAPAIALAGEQDAAAILDPAKVAIDLHPGVILILEHLPDFAGLSVAEKYGIRVLQAIQVLDDEPVVTGPLDVRNISVSRVAGRLHPSCCAAIGAYHADTHRGVCLSRLRILIFGEDRIKSISVVNQ